MGRSTKYELIEVHLKETDLIFCSCCDHESKMVDIYYRIKKVEPGQEVLLYQKYLSCCKDLMGTVVDWEEENYGKVKRSKLPY